MASIQNVVNVSVERATNQATVRDLNTTAILTEHDVFLEDYRIYTTIADMVSDGFVVGDSAHKMATIAFQQSPRPSQVVVGRKESGLSEIVPAATWVEAVQTLEEAYGQWLYLTTDADDTDAALIAAYIETTEKFHVHHTQGIPTANDDGISADLQALGYNRTWVILNTGSDQGVAAAGRAAVFGTRQAGSSVWVYDNIVGLTVDKLTSAQEGYCKASNLDWYTTVENLSLVFGNNKACGGEHIDVMVGVQWIITRMREAVFGAVVAPRKLSFTSGGIAAIESAIRTTIAEAITRDILADDFTPVIIVPNALTFTSAQRNTRNLTGITFQARLAGAILYVDGINGTVFP